MRGGCFVCILRWRFQARGGWPRRLTLGSEARRVSFPGTVGAHLVPPVAWLCPEQLWGAPGGGCVCRSREGRWVGASLEPPCVSPLRWVAGCPPLPPRGPRAAFCRGVAQGWGGRCRAPQTGLLHAWAGAFFLLGLGFPGLLWLPEASALPSWHLGLVPVSSWPSDLGVTAVDQLLRNWLCALPGPRGTGPGLGVGCPCAGKRRL